MMSRYIETASWSTVQRRVRKELRDNLIRSLKEGDQERYELSHAGGVQCWVRSERVYFSEEDRLQFSQEDPTRLLLWSRQGPDAGVSLADRDARMQEVFSSIDWEKVKKWLEDRPAPYEKVMHATLQVVIDGEDEFALQDPLDYVRRWISLPNWMELISVEEENAVPRETCDTP